MESHSTDPLKEKPLAPADNKKLKETIKPQEMNLPEEMEAESLKIQEEEGAIKKEAAVFPEEAKKELQEIKEEVEAAEEEKVDSLQDLSQIEDKSLTVTDEMAKGEKVTEETKETAKITTEEGDLLKEVEATTDNIPQELEEDETVDFTSIKESSDISEEEMSAPSSDSESQAVKKESSLFRNFLDLKQEPGNPPLNYPKKARKMKAQGSLSLIFYLTFDGLVEKIQIESSSGHRELDNSVMRTVARYRFLPEQPGWVRHKVNFILNGEKVEFLRLREK